ncbi:MAG: Eco47II family restriction endonuclease [Microcystis panniformis Mp_MB_F_20051200_S6D]|nr:MAG: Eco47II family restriction endonuclease [Microcystis panniformis Mp_MB_F_20051200_S9D]TRV71201.1 MAG: Eco47II family restriction endonuclease [Microcystis panniformis Mp_MB_F_20051200_S6D]
MPILNFISDENLELAVRFMMNSAEEGLRKADEEFSRNVIDPFSIIFEMLSFGISTVPAWEKSEKARQTQKSLGQALGDFHQMVLGSVEGWINLGVGNNVDLHCPQRNIIAEVKNKHNTVTGAKLVGVYDDLERLVMPNASIYRGYTAYYVEIIPKSNRGYDVEFRPSDRATSSKRPANPNIRKIDGKRFYSLVTEEHNALELLYDALPTIISDMSRTNFSEEDVARMKSYFMDAFQ